MPIGTSNETPYSDGQIFRLVLLHGTREKKLTTRKQTNLKTLRYNSDLLAAFHQLTPYSRLWDDGVNLWAVANLPIAGLKPQLINFLTAILRF